MIRATRPIVLLAFANPKQDLPGLKQESREIRDLFGKFNDVVEVICLEQPSLAEIIATFQEHPNRIAAFHYAGHATNFAILLEGSDGQTHQAGADGLAEFLGCESGLRLVFLNACSTEGQVEALSQAGVGCVIATSRSINDEVAKNFAITFYRGLAGNVSVKTAFDQASSAEKSQHSGRTRALYAETLDPAAEVLLEAGELPLPWNLYPLSSKDANWTLQIEAMRRKRLAKGDTAQETAALRQLQLLLENVKTDWLQKDFDDIDRIELSMADHSDAIAETWQRVDVGFKEQASIVESRDRITDVFDHSSQSLLILGLPGAGKTTALLEIAESLVLRCETENGQPIPTILHLSTWRPTYPVLTDWIVSELTTKYRIGKKHGRFFVENEQLILLFDGLDELPEDLRGPCASAINLFIENHGAPGLLVACRVDEYAAISEPLRLKSAVCLKPLDDQQIDNALKRETQSCMALASILQRHELLRQLAHSPLMFGIMRQAYRGATTIDEAEFGSIENCRKRVFENYVNQMLRTRTLPNDHFTPDESLAGTTQLANAMASSGQSIFLIEQLQPGLLTSTRWRRVYTAAVCLIFGAIAGIAVTIFYASLAPISRDTSQAFEHGLAISITPMYIAWFAWVAWSDRWFGLNLRAGLSVVELARSGMNRTIFLFVPWIAVSFLGLAIHRHFPTFLLITFAGLLASVLVGTYGSSRQVIAAIEPVEAVGYSFKRGLFGMLIGGATGLALSIAHLAWDEPNLHLWFQEKDADSAGHLIFTIILTSLGMEAGAIVGGLVPRTIKGKSRLNQGMRLSAENAWKVGLATAMTFAVTLFTFTMLIKERTMGEGLPIAISVGALVFFCVASWFGGFEILKHWVLRVLLQISGELPKHLPVFLDQAKRLRFVHRVGGGVMFMHRMLLEHFASREVAAKFKNDD